MPEFKITERRTLVQERTRIVWAGDEDAIWIYQNYDVVTDLSDWEDTGLTMEEIENVEAAP